MNKTYNSLKYIHAAFALLLVIFGSGFYARSAEAQLLNINHFLTCVEIVPGGFIANFGYESFETSPSSVFIGPDNFFNPAPGNRGQMSTFFPGYKERAFRINYQTSDGPILNWVLQGVSALASVNSPICPQQPAPPVVTLSITSGGGQSATLSSAFAQAVVINAKVGNRPLRGLTLKATAPATGASASVVQSIVSTDANGNASFNFTANATAGGYNITIAVGTSATPTTTISVALSNQ